MPKKVAWLAAAVIAVMCNSGFAAKKPLVAVSVEPQRYLVEKILGTNGRVMVMVGRGQSPATYEPTIKQMAMLSGADIYFKIGVPFERVWLQRMRAVNRTMRIVDAAEGIRLRPINHIHEGRRQDGELDPHLWTDPLLVRDFMARFTRAVVILDPGQREFYESNLSRLNKILDLLHDDIRRITAGVANRRFIVFHPAWGYFADRYGFVQIPLEFHGKESGSRRLNSVIMQVKSHHLDTVFVQNQFSLRQARLLAAQIGATVVMADPLAYDYPASMRAFAHRLAASRRLLNAGPAQ